MSRIVPINQWGPYAWYFFHVLSFTFPTDPTDIESKTLFYIKFYNVINDLLPCDMCQKHYTKIRKIMPINKKTIKNRSNLVLWVLKVHNYVNLLTGKRSYNYSKLKKLYIVNNQMKINHKFLCKFMHYIINHPPNRKIPERRKKLQRMMEYLIEIFPCQVCRQLIQEFYPKLQDDLPKLLVTLIKNSKH